MLSDIIVVSVSRFYEKSFHLCRLFVIKFYVDGAFLPVQHVLEWCIKPRPLPCIFCVR